MIHTPFLRDTTRMYSSRQITRLDLVDGKVEGDGDGEECWGGGGESSVKRHGPVEF